MLEALDIRRPGRLLGSVVPLLGALLFLAAAGQVEGQNLRGSPASLDRQNAQARAHDFSYLATSSQVRSFVESGYLVKVSPNNDFSLHNVSYPYSRPAVKLFLERFASQYRSACGEQLVVTSLTRPTSEQPANASDRSVHPTGMAIDLRRSGSARCRSWLESTLLSLQSHGVLEIIYERNPSHYHLALYPDPYLDYLAKRGAPVSTVVMASAPVDGPTSSEGGRHRVAPGENLTGIAARYKVSLAELRAANSLRDDRILAGQELLIPGDASVAPTAVRSAVLATSSPAAVVPATHTVVGGESLSEIAVRYGVSLSSLRAENGITGSRILAGQKLRIPGAAGGTGAMASATSARSGTASSAPQATPIHTIARGESLWQIAKSYGVTEEAIRAENGISGSGNRILAGQKLRIPLEAGESAEVLHYTVRNGDSLWVIASRLGTTVDEIRATNGMDATRIYAGQILTVPLSR